MSEYVKLATGAADQYPTALADSQEQFLKTMATFNSMLPEVAAPAIPVPAFAADLPTAKEVVEANFAFASKLLKQQKEFAEKLVAVGSPAELAPRGRWLRAGNRSPDHRFDSDPILQSRTAQCLTPTPRTNPPSSSAGSNQQQWQRTVLAYLDSMTKNDDFLVNLGNAMRGSLLAGKPYPTSPPPAAAGAVPAPAPEVETVPDND